MYNIFNKTLLSRHFSEIKFLIVEKIVPISEFLKLHSKIYYIGLTRPLLNLNLNELRHI